MTTCNECPHFSREERSKGEPTEYHCVHPSATRLIEECVDHVFGEPVDTPWWCPVAASDRFIAFADAAGPEPTGMLAVGTVPRVHRCEACGVRCKCTQEKCWHCKPGVVAAMGRIRDELAENGITFSSKRFEAERKEEES